MPDSSLLSLRCPSSEWEPARRPTPRPRPITVAASVSSPSVRPHRVRGTLATRTHALDVVPASVDLTADAPTVGDQGLVNSCVSWAIDYSLMGWYLHHDGRTGAPLAPMYTYSQLVDGQNVGTYFSDTFDIAEEQGVDAHSHYTQGDYDYVSLPTEAEVANASHWRISGYESLWIGYDPADTKATLQAAMAAGKPVVLGIPVYDNFFDVSAAHPTTRRSPVPTKAVTRSRRSVTTRTASRSRTRGCRLG